MSETRVYVLTERYTGERDVYVQAESKREAMQKARAGDFWDLGEPDHSDYRYVGPAREAKVDPNVKREW